MGSNSLVRPLNVTRRDLALNTLIQNPWMPRPASGVLRSAEDDEITGSNSLVRLSSVGMSQTLALTVGPRSSILTSLPLVWLRRKQLMRHASQNRREMHALAHSYVRELILTLHQQMLTVLETALSDARASPCGETDQYGSTHPSHGGRRG